MADSQISGGKSTGGAGGIQPGTPAYDVLGKLNGTISGGTNVLSDLDKAFLNLDSSEGSKQQIEISTLKPFGVPDTYKGASVVQVVNNLDDSGAVDNSKLSANQEMVTTVKWQGQDERVQGNIPMGTIKLGVDLPAQSNLLMFGPADWLNKIQATNYLVGKLSQYFNGDYMASLESSILKGTKNIYDQSVVRLVIPSDDGSGKFGDLHRFTGDANKKEIMAFATGLGMKQGSEIITSDIDTVLLIGEGRVKVDNPTTNGKTLGSVVAGDITNQTMTGGDGADTLIGGGGTDYLAGGKGSDSFAFQLNGNTVVTDFNKAEGDKITISQDLVEHILSGDLQVVAQDWKVGSYIIGDFNINGSHLVLVGVSVNDITSDMINFDL